MNITDIHRYLSGEASQEEIRELEQWLELSEENRKTFEKYQAIYSVEITHKYQFDKQAALKKFRQIMDSGLAASERKVKSYKYSRRKKSGVWLKVAAAIIAIAGISVYLASNFGSEGVEPNREAIAGTVIETEPGEQKSFRLSDGSRVKLNSASRIYIPENFAVVERSLELEGEAFFDIEQGHELEFIVNTTTARISVLGTTFSVRAWQERDESIVAVQTGRVSLSSSDPEISDQTIISAGQYSQVKAGEAPGPAQEANFDQYLGWTDQMFVFEETPLIDALRQLELHFNVKIIVSDSTSIHDPVTATYRTESLSEILRLTSITHGVEFEVESVNNNNQQ